MRHRHQSRTRLLAAALALTLLLSACGGSGDDEDAPAQRGGTLQVADAGEPLTLNPFVAQDNGSQRVLAQVVEPLFRTDAEGEVVPWLVAKSTPSTDFRTWTFELRPDVTFSDGKPMTPDDVVYSLNAVRKTETWKDLFAEISAVTAGSGSSVVVTTSSPSPSLPSSLALPFAAIVPADLGGATPQEFGENPIGTGPFTVAGWEHGKSLTLERNPTYWDPEKPLLDKVVFNITPSDNSRVLQLRAGDLDLIAEPPLPQLSAIDKASTTKVGAFDMAFPDYLLMNKASATFADARVREAADLAVDRAAIVKAATSGRGEPGGSWFAPSLNYHDKSLSVERDTEKAEELVAEAVADGVDVDFDLVVVSGDSYAKLASQIIKDNLEEVGFSVTVDQLDASARIAQVSAGDYDAALYGMTSDIPEPSEVVGFYLSLDGFWSGGPTDDVGRLFRAAKQEADEDKRRNLYEQVQKAVFEDRALVTLDYRPWTWAMQENVAGFDLPPTGVPWFADVGFN